MKWNVNKSLPICPQICEYVCLRIVNGELKANERISSVREFALKIGVNPNTVQKSYDILEEKQIIYSQRGSGWYVGDNYDLAKEVVKSQIDEKTKSYLYSMNQLGYDFKATIKYLNERYGESNEWIIKMC